MTQEVRVPVTFFIGPAVEKRRAPLDLGPGPIVLFQIEAIKRLVEELAKAPQGSQASAELVGAFTAASTI